MKSSNISKRRALPAGYTYKTAADFIRWCREQDPLNKPPEIYQNGENTMSKDKKSKKKGDNQPSKTAKEKKQAKREKKEKQNEKDNPKIFSS